MTGRYQQQLSFKTACKSGCELDKPAETAVYSQAQPTTKSV